MFMIIGGFSFAGDYGMFRTIPFNTPKQGALWLSNTSFYSSLTVNNILTSEYGISDTRIFSSVTNFHLGITDYLAFTGSMPYYADLFKQGAGNGEKTGPGDVTLGLRVSLKPEEPFIRGLSLGGRISIPEKLGYGEEPLGFRTFSNGELAFSLEASAGLRFNRIEGYVSSAFRQYPKAPNSGTAYTNDLFYDNGFGYLGIGKSDTEGFADIIFQNQVAVSAGAIIPVKSWLSGLVELHAASFIVSPKRDLITRIVPGVRLGRADGFQVCAGIDFALSGPVPDRTYLMKINIPSFMPRRLGMRIKDHIIPDKYIRSRKSLVAIADFTKSDITYPYEMELKNTFHNELSAERIMEILPSKKVDETFNRIAIIPRAVSPEQVGVRLGANYIIKTDISEYSAKRTSSLTIPFVIGFPKTVFFLSAQASVIDLSTGETHNLGVISAKVKKSRGVNFFPMSASSDIMYLSEPERHLMEKQLIDLWVESFKRVIHEKMEVFGWEPKRPEIKGDEDISG